MDKELLEIKTQYENNMNLPTQEDFDKLYATNGTYAFKSMFWETSTTKSRLKFPPIFTLKPYDYNGLPSAYQVYMTSVDEYDAATKIVPNMRVWDTLSETTWFKTSNNQYNFEGLDRWREHMKRRDASTAKAALFEKIAAGDVTASKAILAETKVKSKAGRKVNKTKPELATVNRIDAFKKKVNK